MMTKTHDTKTCSNDNFGKHCCNPNCTKTHCAKHWENHQQIAVAEDLNPDNRFKCPAYAPRFKSRLSRYEKIYLKMK